MLILKVFAGFVLVAVLLIALVGLGFDQPFAESSSWSLKESRRDGAQAQVAPDQGGAEEEDGETETGGEDEGETDPEGAGSTGQSGQPPVQLKRSSSPIVPTPGAIQFSYPEEMRPVPDSEMEAATTTCITGLVFALVNHSHDSQITNYVNPDYTVGSANFIEVDTQFGDIERSDVEPLNELLMYCGPLVDESIYNALAAKVKAPSLVPH